MKTIVTFINQLRTHCEHYATGGLCLECQRELANSLQEIVMMLERRAALDYEIRRLSAQEQTIIAALKERA